MFKIELMALLATLTVSCCSLRVAADTSQGDPLGSDTCDKQASLALFCSPLNSTGDVQVRCYFKNVKTDYWVLTTDLSLEGPSPEEPFYLYRFIGGERKENILQFLPENSGSLEQPVLFKPTVNVVPEYLASSLVLLPREAIKAEFTVVWPEGKSVVEHFGGLSARIKMVVLSKDILYRYKELQDLTLECQRRLRTPSRPKVLDEISFQAGFKDSPVYISDECADELSRLFMHIASNEFLLK